MFETWNHISCLHFRSSIFSQVWTVYCFSVLTFIRCLSFTLSQTLFPQNDSNSHFVLYFPRVHFSEVWGTLKESRATSVLFVCQDIFLPTAFGSFVVSILSSILSSISWWYYHLRMRIFSIFVESKRGGKVWRFGRRKRRFSLLINSSSIFTFCLSTTESTFFLSPFFKGILKCILLFSSLLSSRWKMKMTFFLLQYFDV